MYCRICGRQDARVRLCELKTARITKRAHVDCHGHSEYRSVTVAEVDASIGEHMRHNSDSTLPCEGVKSQEAPVNDDIKIEHSFTKEKHDRRCG